MSKKYFITTPIYYPSAKPHMGHAYSSIVADFFARFKKIDGYDVFFLQALMNMVKRFNVLLKKIIRNL